MKCPRCGKENKEGAKFCGYCGGALEKSPEPDIPPASVSLPRGGKKEKKKKWPWIAGGAGLAAVIIAAAAAAVILPGRSGDSGAGIYAPDQAYEWVLEPSIEADDIFYITRNNFAEYSANELMSQKESLYAVIEMGDSYGLIGQDGAMLGDMDYVLISDSNYGYVLVREAENDTGLYSEWLRDGASEITASDSGGRSVNRGIFYYCDGLHNVNEGLQEEDGDMYPVIIPDTAIPVKQSDSLYRTEDGEYLDWAADLPGKYAVCRNGSLMTDFIYDECGSSSEGLMAVKRDGKWGYVNENGDIVIPIEYDASWEQYQPNIYRMDEYTGEYEEFCYAASDGYIPLKKDGAWELRDTEGTLIIEPDIFEEIRPVYDGKCWVKQDGKWGVVQIKE